MFSATSCDDGFAELNTDPNAANEINPAFQFTYVQLRTSGGRYENWRAGLIYSSMMTQHMSALCGYWSGDKYSYNAGYASSLFDRAYTEQVKEIQDLVATLEAGEVGDATMLGMARIWRVVIFHRLTDLYGDIPYSEAGKGFLEGVDFPKYDAQSDIYDDMLAELEAATAQLTTGGFGDADLIYAGDVDKWKRFGYSMMLRLAMRLSEADVAKAQAWVAKAVAGGTMQDGDNAMIQHTNGPEGINMNGIGEVLDKSNGFGDDCPRLSATMVDWMSGKGDPRLDLIGELPENGTGIHKGMPNGLDNITVLPDSVESFDRINSKLVQVESPMMFMTYAESELLLTEAAIRGWHSGTASTHYENGVRAAMNLYADYDASLAVASGDIDAYLTANPYAGTMEQIGWQYWAVTLLNEYEAYANWRRTGFPTLTPTNHANSVTGGVIPVRLVYPQNEVGLNPGIDEAMTRQGLGSDFSSHLTVPVWWDK